MFVEIVNVLWLFADGPRWSAAMAISLAYWSYQAVMYDNETKDNLVILLVVIWSLDLDLGLWIGITLWRVSSRVVSDQVR